MKAYMRRESDAIGWLIGDIKLGDLKAEVLEVSSFLSNEGVFLGEDSCDSIQTQLVCDGTQAFIEFVVMNG